jgi:hypothetical protein
MRANAIRSQIIIAIALIIDAGLFVVGRESA